MTAQCFSREYIMAWKKREVIDGAYNSEILPVLTSGPACKSQIILDSSQIRFEALGFRKFHYRFRESSRIIKSSSKGPMSFGMSGGISQGGLEFCYRLGAAAPPREQQDSEVVVCIGIIRFEPNRLQQMSFSFLRFFQPHENHSEIVMYHRLIRLEP